MTLSQILPQLFVGSCPANTGDIDRLGNDYGITAILSLQTDDDHDESERSRIEGRCGELGIEVHRVPVEAFNGQDGLRSLSRCVAMLDELLRGGHALYIHCNLGVVRSPSVIIAYLVWRQDWNLTAAVEHVRSCHSCSPDIVAVFLAGNKEGRGAAA